MPPTRHLKVFLCHSSGDKPVVRELYQKLNSEGWIDVWLDEVKLFPGQDWGIEIEKAVEETDIVVVCLSTRSVDKEGYVQRELRYVLNIADEKPEGSVFVIPLRLDECVIPRRLRGWQWLNYFPEDQKQIAYQRLLESLKLRAGKLGISSHESVIPGSEPFEIPKYKQEEQEKIEKAVSTPQKRIARESNLPLTAGIIAGGLLILSLCIWGVWNLLSNLPIFSPEPTYTFQPTATGTPKPTNTNAPTPLEALSPTPSATPTLPTRTPTPSISPSPTQPPVSQPQTGCVVNITHPFIVMKREPSHQSEDVKRAREGRHAVLDHKRTEWGGQQELWFLIEDERVRGWVHFLALAMEKEGDCP